MGIFVKEPRPNILTPEAQREFNRYEKTASHIAGLVPYLDQTLLGDLIEALIERYDCLAGDCDLEEDDPGGGNVDDEGEEQNFEWLRYNHHSIDQRTIYDDEMQSCIIV